MILTVGMSYGAAACRTRRSLAKQNDNFVSLFLSDCLARACQIRPGSCRLRLYATRSSQLAIPQRRQVMDYCDEFREINRLRHVDLKTGSQSTRPVFAPCEGRESDRRHRLSARQCAQALDQLIAVVIRQPDVADHTSGEKRVNSPIPSSIEEAVCTCAPCFSSIFFTAVAESSSSSTTRMRVPCRSTLRTELSLGAGCVPEPGAPDSAHRLQGQRNRKGRAIVPALRS